MLSKEELLKQRERREKRKKIFLICICVVVIIFLLFVLVTIILSAINNYAISQAKKKLEQDTNQNYVYPKADYKYDIFTDSSYMRLDRGIWFNNDGEKTVMTDETYKNYPIEAQFMYDVVNLIIEGKFEEYNEIFTEDYLKNAGKDLREEFTMQKLFAIEIESLDSYEMNNLTCWDVQLDYRIKDNNGTFRNDLDFNDDGSIPVVYTLVYDKQSIKVTDILSRYKYDSGLY